MTTKELLNCPFCNGECIATKGYATEQVWPHGDFHRVYCTACQSRQLFHKTGSDAVAAWNRRVEASQPQKPKSAPTETERENLLALMRSLRWACADLASSLGAPDKIVVNIAAIEVGVAINEYLKFKGI